MSKIIILVGCPASGKSTYAKELHKKNRDYVIVSRDEIREARGSFWLPKQEKYINDIEAFEVSAALKHGLTPIVDATNLSNKSIKRWEKIAAEYGAEIEVKTFDVPYEEARERDYWRGVYGGRAVGERVLRDYYKKFKKKDFSSYPAPQDYNHYDQRIIKEPNYTLPPCIICDLDSTLAIHKGRDPFDFDNCDLDYCDPRLANILEMYMDNGVEVIFLSGRDDSCYDKSLSWITSNLQGCYQKKPSGLEPRISLYMRKTGDKRSDQVVKKELYEQHIKDQYNVMCVFDDRDKVVDMWRKEGLLCCQVYYGNF